MTRLGKIARLPREVREELNVRLQNGEVGRVLLEWLNGLPAAQAVLAAHFGGRVISQQNLSEWKLGGYEDWVRHQENCAYASILTEMAGDLEAEAGETSLAERLAVVMAMALARLLREAEESTDGAERQKTILEVARRLSQLRRDGFQAERVRAVRERREQKQDEIEEKERQKEVEEAQMAAVWAQTKAEFPALRPLAEIAGQWKGLKKGRGSSEEKGPAEARDEVSRPDETDGTNRTDLSETNQNKPKQTCGEEG